MKSTKVCPRCGSKNIAPYMGFDTGMQYQCQDCGYMGALVVEKVLRKARAK
jgi:transposase-like protein